MICSLEGEVTVNPAYSFKGFLDEIRISARATALLMMRGITLLLEQPKESPLFGGAKQVCVHEYTELVELVGHQRSPKAQ